MREFSRTDRMADFLRKELGQLIHQQMRDPRVGMCSVTDVEVSRDLSHAKVYVTVLGQESEAEAKDTVAVLNKAAGFLRSGIARINNARITPSLRFYYDTSVVRGNQLSRLIDNAVAADRRADDQEQDGRDADDSSRND